MTNLFPSRMLLAALTLLTLLITLNSTCDNQPAQTGKFDFPQVLTPDIPADIGDLTGMSFDEKQRMFDILSWQSFVAVNWPVSHNGKLLAKLSDNGMPAWTTYKESMEIFKEDGSAPSSWGNDRDIDAIISGGSIGQDAGKRTNRLLLSHNKHSGRIADESNQAFSGDIWDQNGNLVMYEVVVNKEEFEFIDSFKLYNVNGQIEFSRKGKPLVFPEGIYNTETIGAIEIKVSWKILDTITDIASRYLTMDGYIPDPKDYTVNDTSCIVTFPKNPKFVKVKLGMVGMHIAHKTKSSPQWIWSTFEHVDNLTADPLVTGKTLNGTTVNLAPSFYNPDCIDCLPNTCPNIVGGKRKSQLMRAIPIPGDKRDLNNQASRTLANLNSALQYYQLIDTQWPVKPKKAPTPPNNGVASVTNKAGGDVTPVMLTNITMESYFQTGVQMAYGREEDAGKMYPGNHSDSTLIFATESCVGCHYSAPVAIGYSPNLNGLATQTVKYGPPQSADFSWLLKKASPVKIK